jgi:chromosome segregation ATPase
MPDARLAPRALPGLHVPADERGDHQHAGVSTVPHLTVQALLVKVAHVDPELTQALGALGQRMDGLEQRMDGLEQRMDGLEQRMDGLEQRMDGLEHRLTGEIQASEARMRELIRSSADETQRYTAVLIEGLRADFRIATEGLTPVTRRVDVLEQHHEQTQQRVDVLETRVSVLERAAKTRRPRRR